MTGSQPSFRGAGGGRKAHHEQTPYRELHKLIVTTNMDLRKTKLREGLGLSETIQPDLEHLLPSPQLTPSEPRELHFNYKSFVKLEWKFLLAWTSVSKI
jgi:hypothetical protein